MPQLVKGGKYVFGWSVVDEDGRILLPGEAVAEYGIEPGERVFLMSGSRISGGFSVSRKSTIERSNISDILAQNPDLAGFRTEEGQIIKIGIRSLCWLTTTEGGGLRLLPPVLEAYGVKPEGRLLAARGSYMGIGMLVKGPIVNEAVRHPEIPVFQAGR